MYSSMAVAQLFLSTIVAQPNVTTNASVTGAIEGFLADIFRTTPQLDGSCVKGDDCLLPVPEGFDHSTSSFNIYLVEEGGWCSVAQQTYLSATLAIDGETSEGNGNHSDHFRLRFLEDKPALGLYKICICMTFFASCPSPLNDAAIAEGWTTHTPAQPPGLVPCVMGEASSSYPLCMCLPECSKGRVVALDYAVTLGRVDFVGPEHNQSFDCTLGRNCSFNVRGHGLTVGDRLTFVEGRDPTQCGAAAASPLLLDGESLGVQGVGEDGGWVSAFLHGDNLRSGGAFSICWCTPAQHPGTGCEAPIGFAMPAGSLSVLGPLSSQNFVCYVGYRCEVTIRGFRLSPLDQLSIKTSPLFCGSPNSSALEAFPSQPFRVSRMQLTSAQASTSFALPAPQRAGVFTLCYCTSPGTLCDSAEKFASMLGSITVNGVIENQTFDCTPYSECRMRISGIGLDRETDRLLVTRGPSCPPSSSDVVPDEQPAASAAAAAAAAAAAENVLISGYSSLSPSPGAFLNSYHLTVLGTYTVCVCAAHTRTVEPPDRGQEEGNCTTPEDFTLKAGVVRSIGILRSSVEAVVCGAMDANCVFNFTGDSFGINSGDRATLVAAGSCSSLPRREVSISFPVYIYPGLSPSWGILVPPRAIPAGANYTICYCAADLDNGRCALQSSYHLHAGELIVSGSVESTSNHSCLPSEVCMVSIRGLSLHPRDRLKVLNDASRPCSNIVVEKFGDRIINMSDLTNDRLVSTFRMSPFGAADSFTLCYCPFTGLPDWVDDPCSARTPHKAGILHVEGFMPTPGGTPPTLGRYKGTVTLPVRMIGQPNEKWKIGIRPEGQHCNASSNTDDAAVAEVNVRAKDTLVVDVSQLPQGRYRACGCVGKCDEESSPDAPVDLGSIEIVGPALDVTEQNSTAPYIPCAAGHPCEVSGVGDIQGAEIFLTTLPLPSNTGGQPVGVARVQAEEGDVACGDPKGQPMDTPVGRGREGSFALPQYSFGSIRTICACMKIAGSLDGWDCSKPEHFNIAIGAMVISGPLETSDSLRCPVQSSDCRVEIDGVLLHEGDRAVMLAEGECGEGSSVPKGDSAEIKLNEDRSVGEFNFGKTGSAVESYKVCYCHDAASGGCHRMEQFTLATGPLDVYFRLNAFHILGIIAGCLFLALVIRYVWVRVLRRRFATGAHQLDFDETGNAKIGYEYTTEVGGLRGGRTKTRVIWRPQDKYAEKAALDTLRNQLPERVDEPIEDDEDLGEDDDVFHVPEDDEEGGENPQESRDLSGSSIRRSAMKVPRARTCMEAWEEVEGPLSDNRDDDTLAELMRGGSSTNGSYSRNSLHRRAHRSPRGFGLGGMPGKISPEQRVRRHGEDTRSVCGTTAPHTPEETKETESL